MAGDLAAVAPLTITLTGTTMLDCPAEKTVIWSVYVPGASESMPADGVMVIVPFPLPAVGEASAKGMVSAVDQAVPAGRVIVNVWAGGLAAPWTFENVMLAGETTGETAGVTMPAAADLDEVFPAASKAEIA
ncbi:MAG: hypothetical protein A3J70_06370 [Elusimicrobia bacterium RIFCSPHIGHO2_02_FULL_61_10]|nr:MAG: hypothetical protein A3J70_06370 [Elusimicrobia bacterium RIFCSPHIGHO2_02_FULL_61_10]